MVAVAAVTSTGVGVGWRSEISGLISARPDLDFLEVMAESVDPSQLPPGLCEPMERRRSIFVHGVSLSLGSAELPEVDRVRHLGRVADALGAEIVSEHIAFVRAGGRSLGHLTPLPRTREAVAVFAENYRIAASQLNQPLALENIASFLQWPNDELTEAQFLAEILEATAAPLLLDVANCHANAVNNGDNLQDLLSTLPLERIAYVHVAGGYFDGDFYHDSHKHDVPEPVWELLGQLLELRPDLACMIERDGLYDLATLSSELDRLVALTTRARV